MSLSAIKSRLQRHLPHGGFRYNFAVLSFGTFMAQCISLLSMPLLTRLYLPENFGVFALFASLSSVIALIATLRFDAAVMLPADDREAAALVKAATLFAVVVSLLSGVLVFLFIRTWFPAIGDDLNAFTLLFTLSTFGSSASQTLVNWFARRKNFRLLALRNFLDRLVFTPLSLLLATTGLKSSGLMVSQFAGIAVTLLLLIVVFLRDRQRPRMPWNEVFPIIQRYKDFPLKSSWSSVFSLIAWQAPILILSRFMSASQLGYLNLAVRLLEAPVYLVGSSFSLAYYQRTSRSNGPELAALMRKTLIFIGGTGILGGLALTLVSDNIFELVFGAGWGQAMPIVRALFLLYVFRLVYVSQTPLFYIMRKLSAEVVTTLALVASQVSICYFGAKAGVPLLKIVLMLGISAACIIVMASINLFLGTRHHKVG